jgi:nickel-dependent lactate racemase
MEIELKYGDGRKTIRIPDRADVTILKPAEFPAVGSITDTLKKALSDPLGCQSFQSMLQQADPETIAIAVPDETRPLPLKPILPVILGQIRETLPALVSSAITIIIGGGLHPPLDDNGRESVVPRQIAPDCRIIAHDALRNRMVDFGLTSRKTPVRINADFAEADFKIVIGQIDPHQFVGFTGGAKGVVIGCAASETIEHNHSLMFFDGARVGRIAENPVREDLNEAGEMVGIHLALNVVLDAEKNIVQMLAGKPLEVLKKGAETCSAVYGVCIAEKFDIVIASCGGHPKDICLYQAQKGLNLASQALSPGGHILLLAASPQGVGDDIYFDYVSQFTTPEEVLSDFKKTGFRMGAHKAYLFGRTMAEFDVAISSDLDPGILRKCHLRAADPTVIVGEWVDAFKGRPRIAVVPNANTTYFYHG